ncbi:HD domain-containing phosphohydrolase [Marinobacter sp. F4216]|uniref:HD domain-containing phosphohydrolase n=1 Tax=Marinobacter sp. F4216 TaxID=2874281 RepID=UPI001CBF27B2|nr:HD domain-containing phosphohydrolase [Marinobacter sp. F4216]MBZ2167490.1 phosphodiesterase [Marinobacter sp. F4216]
MPRRHPAPRVSLAMLIAAAVSLGMLLLTLIMVGQSFLGLERAKVTAASDAAHQLVMNADDRLRSVTRPPAITLALLSHDPLGQAKNLEERLERLPAIVDILKASEVVSAVYVGYPNGEFFQLRKVVSSGLVQFHDAPRGAAYLVQASAPDGSKGQRLRHFYDAALNPIGEPTIQESDYDPRNRDWFRTATRSAQAELSPPYVFFSTGETGITLSHRASEGDAVFGMDATVSDIKSQLSELKPTANTRVAILNGEQEILVDTGGGAENEPVLLAAAQHKGTTIGSSSVRRFRMNDQYWYGTTETSHVFEEEPLTVAVVIPSKELLAQVWKLLTQQALIAGLIGLAMAIIGWFLGRRVARPLETLTNRVGQLSQFRFDNWEAPTSRVREAHQLGSALDDMAGSISSFQRISNVLNLGQNLNELLHDILTQILSIVGEKRGGIYLFSKQAGALNLAVDKDPGLPKHIKGVSSAQPNEEMILSLGQQLAGHPLVTILRNRNGKLVGTLVIEMERGDHAHLSDEMVAFVHQISGSAAVAIETRELIESQQALLDGTIQLVANAIDSKSHYTAAHCTRVPQLAEMLVDEAIASDQEAFAGFTLSDEERYEFRLAAWLHDCGKITSPEHVVDKAVKLETIHNRIHEIRTRFEVLHRDADIRYLKRQLSGDDEAEAHQERDATQKRLQQEFAFIASVNHGGEALSDSDIERIHTIGRQTWQRHFSDRLGLSWDEAQATAEHPEPILPTAEALLSDKPEHTRPWGEHRPPVQRDDPGNHWGFDMALPDFAANKGELHNLTITRGTLTPEERFRVNEHIVQTICMLETLPLPDRLANVPRLAGTHHERMDGQGYPRRLISDQLSIPERIMVLADVFEALTASDRPYKDAKSLTESLSIVARMVDDGHIDRDIFTLFIRSGIYRRYAECFLAPEQIDHVDERLFMTPD